MLFVGKLLQHLWQANAFPAEVLSATVDNGGYDVVIECNSAQRHIQLKSQISTSGKKHISVNERLGLKPSGCVVWMIVHPETLSVERFLWLGNKPGDALPSLAKYPRACRTTPNSKGEKPERANTRKLPSSAFEILKDIAAVVDRLFGPCTQMERGYDRGLDEPSKRRAQGSAWEMQSVSPN